MMPPPSSFSRRRTRVNHFPLSPPSSPETSPCGPRKMSLSKATTFHIPPSPPSDYDPVLSIPHLPRRSPTAPKKLLALMLGKDEGVEDSIARFEKRFTGNHSRWSDKGLNDRGSRIRSARESPLDLDGLKTVQETHEHLSDSGLGTSISSAGSRPPSISQAIESTTDRLLLLGVASTGSPSKADCSSTTSDAKYIAKGSVPNSDNNRLPHAIHSPDSPKTVRASAITRSISPSHTNLSSQSSLGPLARQKIEEAIFEPILAEEEFRAFHPLAHSLEAQLSRQTVKCLRDLEKSLIFEPLSLTRSPIYFRRFAEFSIQLVLDTYPHLSEPEQRRAADRPYDNGYFLDLVQQVGRLAAQIGARRESGEADEMGPTIDDRVTLEGGLSETGEIAELVRWDKEGQGWSMRTGQLYEPTAGIKRSASILDEEVERSMARRKKGAEPLQMRCSDETCGKIFTRKCDLAKHEKTHSRPFKCPEKTCKYHDMGLPTEKERDRHVNDKHSANPHFYHCQFCPFKTKRDSNCKQHMEKKHGWQYDRVKGNGRTKSDTIPASTPQQTPQATPQTPAVSTPISVDYSSVHSSTAPNSAFPTPMEHPSDTFSEYHYESATPVHLGGSLFNNNGRFSSVGDNAYGISGGQAVTVETPYSAISNITEQQMNTNDLDMYGSGDVNFALPQYPTNFTMASPYSPNYESMKVDPNIYTQMPMTPSTSSGHLATGSRNPSVSLTTPLSIDNLGLAQTISPQLSLEDDFMDFTAPTVQNNQFNFGSPSGMGHANIPMGDFSLFGSDGYVNHAGDADAFDTFINLQDDSYEA